MEVNEWVIVASRTQAKIFRRTDTRRPLKWIYTLVNRQRRPKNRVLPEEGSSTGQISSSLTERNSPHEVIMERFAKKISEAIKMGSDQHAFTKLYVFCEPHMLGRIKKHQPKSLKTVEVAWIGKDLEKETADEILSRVS